MLQGGKVKVAMVKLYSFRLNIDFVNKIFHFVQPNLCQHLAVLVHSCIFCLTLTFLLTAMGILSC